MHSIPSVAMSVLHLAVAFIIYDTIMLDGLPTHRIFDVRAIQEPGGRSQGKQQLEYSGRTGPCQRQNDTAKEAGRAEESHFPYGTVLPHAGFQIVFSTRVMDS